MVLTIWHSLAQNKFIKSGALYSIASFGVSVISYFFNLLIARNFSLADYGEYMTAMAYTFIFGIPLAAFSMVVIRKIGRTKLKDKIYVALAIRSWLLEQLQHFLPYILIVSLVGGFVLFYRANLSLITILFIFAFSFISLFSSFYLAVLQAYKVFFIASIFLIVSGLLKFVGGLGVVFIIPTLFWLYVSIIASGLLAIFLGDYLSQRGKNLSHRPPKIKFSTIQDYIRKPTVYIPLLTTLGLIGLTSVDIILAKKFLSADQTGLYASLSLMGKIILYLTAPISTVAYSFFSSHDSDNQTSKILILTTFAFVVIGGVSVTGYVLYPELILSIIFGPKFIQLSSLLYLSATFGFLYSLITLYSQYFVSQNSSWGMINVLAVALQAALIYFWHTSIEQIFMINIAVFALLLVSFYVKLAYTYLKNS